MTLARFVPNQPLCDAGTIDRARRGDQEAISTIFEACYPKVLRFCLARLRDEDAAADAASEVVEKMLRALPKYRRTDVPFEAWLFRIARNKVIDIVRREKRRTEISMQLASAPGVRDYEYERILHRDIIQHGLETLTRTQRKVIVMRFIDGHDVNTVASAIGRTKQATKSLQFRAVASMRKALREQGEPDRPSASTGYAAA